MTDATVTMDGNNAVVNVNYLLPAGNLYIVNYTIYPSGAVNVAARFTSTDMDAAQTEVSEATRTATFTPGRDAARKEASKLNVPRIGVRFRLPASMNQVEYFGRGPAENYLDRNAGSMVGLYNLQPRNYISHMYARRKTVIIPTLVGYHLVPARKAC